MNLTQERERERESKGPASSLSKGSAMSLPDLSLSNGSKPSKGWLHISVVSIFAITFLVSSFFSDIQKAQAAVSFIQSATGVNDNTISGSATLGSSPTAGHLLVATIGVKESGKTINTPSGWSVAIKNDGAAGDPLQAIFYKISDGTDGTVTVTTATTVHAVISILEYSGVSTLDVVGTTNTGSSTTPASNSIAASQTNQLILISSSENAGVTHAWSGATGRTDAAQGGNATNSVADITATTSGNSYSASATTTNHHWRTDIVSFKSSFPTGIFNSAIQKTNGTGKVDASITVNDADRDNSKAKIEYSTSATCATGRTKATLTTPLTATVTPAPDLTQANTYQIGTTTPILTSSANTITFVWDSKTDLPSASGGTNYYLCLTTNDGTSNQTSIGASSAIAVDNVAPSGYIVVIDQAYINNSNQTAISFTFTGAEVGSTYFYSFTGTSGTPVTGSGTVSLSNQQITGINLSGLSEGTITLTAYLTDVKGNQGSNTTNQKTTDTTDPTFTMQYYYDSSLTLPIADNAKLGVGIYYVKIISNEPLSGVPMVSILAEGVANDVVHGAASLVSGNVYKYTRTIIFDAAAVGSVMENWSVLGTDLAGNTAADVNPTNELTKDIYADTVSPTAPGNLTLGDRASSSITLNFGAATTELNFDRYKIFYKQAASGVAESDTQHLDSNLEYIDYNSAANTVVSGLLASTQYVFNIWAYDIAGNKVNASEIALSTLAGNSAPNVPTLVSPASGFSTNDNAPTLSANYTDSDIGDLGTTDYRIATSPDGCLAGVVVASGTSAVTLSNSEDTTWTPTSSIGSDATYYWCTRNDDGVAQSAWTSMGSFMLDTTSPAIAITVPAKASNATITNTTTPAAAATVPTVISPAVAAAAANQSSAAPAATPALFDVVANLSKTAQENPIPFTLSSIAILTSAGFIWILIDSRRRRRSIEKKLKELAESFSVKS